MYKKQKKESEERGGGGGKNVRKCEKGEGGVIEMWYHNFYLRVLGKNCKLSCKNEHFKANPHNLYIIQSSKV